jgi:tetratricopeptide (TPR) repeat protein
MNDDKFKFINDLLDCCAHIDSDLNEKYDKKLLYFTIVDLLLQSNRDEGSESYFQDNMNFISELDNFAFRDLYDLDYMKEVVDIDMMKNICITNNGHWLYAKGRFDESIRFFESAIDGYKYISSNFHPNINNNRFYIIESLASMFHGDLDDVRKMNDLFEMIMEEKDSDIRKIRFIHDFNLLILSLRGNIEETKVGTNEKVYINEAGSIYYVEGVLEINSLSIAVKKWGCD